MGNLLLVRINRQKRRIGMRAMVERNGKSSLGDNQKEKEELGMRAILERNGKSSLGEKNKKKESGVNVKNWGCGPCRRGTGFLLSVRIKKEESSPCT